MHMIDQVQVLGILKRDKLHILLGQEEDSLNRHSRITYFSPATIMVLLRDLTQAFRQ